MYATFSDLKRRLEPSQLLQLAEDGSESQTPEQVMQEAILEADREIDSYVGRQKSVPLDPVPDLVRDLSARIAIYRLFMRREHAMSDARRADYKDCIRLLEKIPKGEISLGAANAEEGGETGETEEAMDPGRTVVQTRPTEFTDLDKL